LPQILTPAEDQIKNLLAMIFGDARATLKIKVNGKEKPDKRKLLLNYFGQF
jgi:hypothetical protein